MYILAATFFVVLGVYLTSEVFKYCEESQARIVKLEQDLLKHQQQGQAFRVQIIKGLRQFGGQVGAFIVAGDCANIANLCQHENKHHRGQLDCKKIYQACLKRGSK